MHIYISVYMDLSVYRVIYSSIYRQREKIHLNGNSVGISLVCGHIYIFKLSYPTVARITCAINYNNK